MFPKFLGVVDGFQFIAGVDIKKLQDTISTKDTFKEWHHTASSFFGLSKALVSLTPAELNEMGGFAAVVQPNQVIEIPAGFIIAQTSLSNTCTYVHWVACRPSQLSWDEQIKVASDAVDQDYQDLSKQDPGAVSQTQLAFLKKVEYQLALAPILLKWFRERAARKEESRFFRTAEGKQHDGVSSLDSLRQKFATDTAFSNAVTCQELGWIYCFLLGLESVVHFFWREWHDLHLHCCFLF